MRIKIEDDKSRPGSYVVTPYGSIDSSTYLEFKEKTDPLLVKHPKSIVVNLEGVDYISSAGLGVLFGMKKALRTNGGDLYFCHIKPQIRRLFEIVKALPAETLFASYEEADRYLYKMMNDEIEKNRRDQNGD
ncbi:MAG: hypothetical protein MOGMAGMI_00591 [Candidatus Omnitrophica bacterium]|nr:hypothetical protein [Candidatus Omnitrophota bacterium]